MVPGEPQLLLRRRHPHEERVRAGGVHGVHDGPVGLLAPRAERGRERPRDPESRPAGRAPLADAPQGPLRRSQEEDRHALPLGPGQEGLDEVRAGDALGHRAPAVPGAPHRQRAVGQDRARLAEVGAEGGHVLGHHDGMRVGGGEERLLAGGDAGHGEVHEGLAGEAPDRHSEDDGGGAHGVLRGRTDGSGPRRPAAARRRCG